MTAPRAPRTSCRYWSVRLASQQCTLQTYDDEVSDNLSKGGDVELSGTVDGGEDDLSRLADESVDLSESSREDVLDLNDEGGKGLDGAVLGVDVV